MRARGPSCLGVHPVGHGEALEPAAEAVPHPTSSKHRPAAPRALAPRPARPAATLVNLPRALKAGALPGAFFLGRFNILDSSAPPGLSVRGKELMGEKSGTGEYRFVRRPSRRGDGLGGGVHAEAAGHAVDIQDALTTARLRKREHINNDNNNAKELASVQHG